jgi:hypothetical protein
VDVTIVIRGDRTPPKLGKFALDGALVEVGYTTWAGLPSAEHVLGTFYLAGSLRQDTVIADPTGRLAVIHAETAEGWAKRVWVRRRCEDAERRITRGLHRLDLAQPPHDLLTGWLFPTGVTTMVLLTAALRNPTVRLRYVKCRALLAEYGHLASHEELLRLLGSEGLSRERVEEHLRAMTELFDATMPLARTPFFFSSDITSAARPIAVDSIRELVEQGLHREAVFWIAATYARCMKILHTDAPHALPVLAPGFAALAADLGAGTTADVERRRSEVLGFLPRLRGLAEEIMEATPGIEG